MARLSWDNLHSHNLLYKFLLVNIDKTFIEFGHTLAIWHYTCYVLTYVATGMHNLYLILFKDAIKMGWLHP